MKKIQLWKIIFALCCLVYMGWTINVGTNEFDRINGQYRRIIQQLEPDRIKTAAIEELTEECRRLSKWQTGLKVEDCYNWPPALLKKTEIEIEARLLRAKERAIIKMVLFYTGFVLIFLLAPPILLYLLIIGIIKLKNNIKIVS
jgi:hypothetical protein